MIEAFNGSARPSTTRRRSTTLLASVGWCTTTWTTSVRGFMMAGENRDNMLSEYISAVENDRIRAPRISEFYKAHLYCSVEDIYSRGKEFHLPDEVCSMALGWNLVSQHGSGRYPGGAQEHRDPNWMEKEMAENHASSRTDSLLDRGPGTEQVRAGSGRVQPDGLTGVRRLVAMPDTRLPTGEHIWDDTNEVETPKILTPWSSSVSPASSAPVATSTRSSSLLCAGARPSRSTARCRLNDSIVGALLFAIDKLIREVEWKVVPADQSGRERSALGVPGGVHGRHVPLLGRLHLRGPLHAHLRLELARDRLQASAGPVAEGPQEAVQVRGRPDRLAQDADPLPGDAAALGLR